MVAGNYETGKAGWTSGEAHLNKARVMSEACGQRKTWETAMSTLGNHKRLEGYFEAARGWSDLTMQASLERGIDHGIVWSHDGRARNLLCLCDFDALREDVASLERMPNDPSKTGNANDNSTLVFQYTKAFCALNDGRDSAAIAALTTMTDLLATIRRPQIYMVQDGSFYADIIWALWHRGHRDTALLERHKRIVKSGKQVAKQYRSRTPIAELAQGDAAWFAGDEKAAGMFWRASMETATELKMPYNAAQSLYRLEQAGFSETQGAWRPVLNAIGIARPAIWNFDA